jgi:hypothetical protein
MSRKHMQATCWLQCTLSESFLRKQEPIPLRAIDSAQLSGSRLSLSFGRDDTLWVGLDEKLGVVPAQAGTHTATRYSIVQ